MVKLASITLTFNVADEALLSSLSDRAIERHGAGVELDQSAPLACRIAELLLHSNPAIAPFLDYGIELLGTKLSDCTS